MQPLLTRTCNTLLHAVPGVLSLIAGALIYLPAAAQPITSDSTHIIIDSAHTLPQSPANTHRDIVTSFEEFNMPIEMVVRFTQLTPKGILMFHDEFQVMKDGDYGDEIDMIKVWFIEDHLVGYVIETPLERSQGAPITKWKIDIPITWCCRPTIEGHVEHCANSLNEVKADETSNKCTGWHIKMPPPLPPEPKVKLQKIKKPKKGSDDKVQVGDKQNAAKPETKKKSRKKDKKPGFQVSDSTAAKEPGSEVPGVKP